MLESDLDLLCRPVGGSRQVPTIALLHQHCYTSTVTYIPVVITAAIFLYYIFVIDFTSVHELPHVVITGRLDHSRMATNETLEQREARLARRREQY